MKEELTEKMIRILEDIDTFFSYPWVQLRFKYRTQIYPRKAKHYWCKFYDPITKTEREGWYVLDKKGEMIPWVHYEDGCMCVYPDMITTIEK